ncbi:hypothetical protein K9L97_05710 [Candidatus Woesearchaeota archaeon]|nr:hypothetical protein [Candidatus Woesearchaeota archaeon]
MINKKQIQQIKKFGVELDWNLTFGGKSKGNRHLFRAHKKALNLCDKNIRKDIVEAAIWLHDTNLEKTIIGSTLVNKNKIIKFLKKIKINDEDIKKIMHCIEAHDGRIKAKTKEAMIVHDADTLEKSGSLGIIRETWKKSQAGWTTEKISKHLEKHLLKRENNMYTKKAKKIAKKNNQEIKIFFEQLKEQLKEK